MKEIIKYRLLVISTIIALFFGGMVPAQVVNAATGDTVVYITKTGKCYHNDGCSSLRSSKIETTLQNAVDKGLKPCSKCNPSSIDAATATIKVASTTATKASKKAKTTTKTKTKEDSAVEALKTYKGNTKEFNAYTYYMNYEDLQTAIGADGEALLKHYNDYGKAEKRVAK